MLKPILKQVLKRIEARRKWNRTRRFLQERAQSRLIVGLVASGALTGTSLKRLWS